MLSRGHLRTTRNWPDPTSTNWGVGAGPRSSIAASLLRHIGRDDVSDLLGGYGAWLLLPEGRRPALTACPSLNPQLLCEAVISTTEPSSRLTEKLTPAVLRELLRGESAPRLLDVRTPGEFHTAHIPGSYNVPLDTLREHRAELRQHLDEQVVLICRSGNRAGQAQQALAEAGLPNLRVLDGGMLAWEAAQCPVMRGKPRWDL